MNLRRYVGALRRYWLLVVALTVLGATAGFASGSDAAAPSSVPTPAAESYYATATLLQDQSASVAGTVESSLGVNLDALFVRSPAVSARAAEILGYDGEPAELLAQITTSADASLGTLSVTATGDTPEEAETNANAFADALMAFLLEKNTLARGAAIASAETTVEGIQTELNATTPPGPTDNSSPTAAQYNALVDAYQNAFGELARLRTTTPSAGLVEGVPPVGIAGDPPVVFTPGQPAPEEEEPTEEEISAEVSDSRLSRPVRALAAGLFGFLLALGLVFVLEWFDPRLRTGDDAEEAFGLPVLAEIPRARRRARRGAHLVMRRRGCESVAEAYRQLRAVLSGAGAIHHVASENGSSSSNGHASGALRTLLITSASDNVSSTEVVANLVAAFAEFGRSAIAISTRYDDDELSAYFGVTAGPGLADALEAGAASIDAIAQPTQVSGARIVPAGVPQRSTAELAHRAQHFIRDLDTGSVLVVVDTPPLLESSATADLATVADAVLVVCGSGRTTRAQAALVSDRLALLGAVVAGVVVVDATGGPQRMVPRPRATVTTVPGARPAAAKAIVPEPIVLDLGIAPEKTP